MYETHLSSQLPNINLNNKRVFLRADLNVPLHNDRIINDYRLRAVKPTIDYILNHGGTIILATHIGRPISYNANVSTSLLLPWFKEQGYTVHYQADINIVQQPRPDAHITLLENLRFFPGEKHPDPSFAQLLASHADIYVNDAFGVAHRKSTSTTLLPTLFNQSDRTIGFLIEQELRMLNQLREDPPRPYIIILGGGKVHDKISLIDTLLDKIDALMLCPALVFTFIQSLGKPVGKSLVDETALEACVALLAKARRNKVTIYFPTDYQIALDTFNGSLAITPTDAIPPHAVGISIGYNTVKEWTPIICKAKTIFYNGLMGSLQRPETLHGIDSLLKAIGTAQGLKIVGGGDSVAAAQFLGHMHTMSYLSTGGGATLEYLAGHTLPGLQIFLNK